MAHFAVGATDVNVQEVSDKILWISGTPMRVSGDDLGYELEVLSEQGGIDLEDIEEKVTQALNSGKESLIIPGRFCTLTVEKVQAA